MKRNENLVPLSRDHHFGLLCCWKIRQGIKKNIPYERIKNYVADYWGKNLSRHFDIEDLVLPEVNNEPLQIQMQDEHRQIRKLIKSISQAGSRELLSDFADALHKHIRFEERMIFPYLEEQLSGEELDTIGEHLLHFHRKEEDSYPDEFWK
ncbi:hemerythrin domain-containing protein [Chryseobacterium sp. MHB01]|uniref:hemerythrin domain-containing protein n=1 Tax=unclassified Chryseobacterium TaxID=2593645 RepID=UPI002AFFD120|nr:hemerythrin domain-containing protein [Chryseobacterium sp. MHB01]MEA1847547.1 hemerythrin domain-containing protein [Chryseobacterium sp. MHB01]